MADGSTHLLLAGVTTRALAVSAARAGYRVTAVDAFGDLDLREVADVVPLAPDAGGFAPGAAAAAARGVRAGLVAYTSNFENHPESVRALARGRRLLGNGPDVLRRVRDPMGLARALRRRGFAVPRTRATAPDGSGGSWLLKPRRSGGGHGVRVWRAGLRVPRTSCVQERIRGVPGSVIFLADGRRARPLGLTRQLVGASAFGARGFRYCGSLLGSGATLFPDEVQLRATAEALAHAVTEEYGLVGLNGLDFIARRGVPYPIEVNPRVCASMELLERMGGGSLFELHERACRGILPRDPIAAPGAPFVAGKAVVFARRPVVVAGFGRGAAWVADVPGPGERIAGGRPICTVFAEGRDAEACLRGLAARAGRIYAALEPRASGLGAA